MQCNSQVSAVSATLPRRAFLVVVGAVPHTRRMSVAVAVPQWVVPAAVAVRDYRWLAWASAEHTGSRRLAGHVAAVDWVATGGVSPVCGRYVDCSVAEVRAEMMAANFAESGLPAMPGLEPVVADREWCGGVALALGWLLGVHAKAAFRIPARGEDGAPCTADELYAAAATAKGRRLLPEEQRAARATAERDAGLYRRLADLVDSLA